MSDLETLRRVLDIMERAQRSGLKADEWTTFKTARVLQAAARRFLALTETGRRLVDAVDVMYDENDLFTAEEEEWGELLDAAIEVRAALADYLTEEETE